MFMIHTSQVGLLKYFLHFVYKLPPKPTNHPEYIRSTHQEDSKDNIPLAGVPLSLSLSLKSPQNETTY